MDNGLVSGGKGQVISPQRRESVYLTVVCLPGPYLATDQKGAAWPQIAVAGELLEIWKMDQNASVSWSSCAA